MAQVLILKTQTDLIKVQSKRQELKLFQTNQIYTKIHVVSVFQKLRNFWLFILIWIILHQKYRYDNKYLIWNPVQGAFKNFYSGKSTISTPVLALRIFPG